MISRTFRVGDKVVCNAEYVDDMRCGGRRFKIININTEVTSAKCECIDPRFNNDRHSGRYGWWIPFKNLELSIDGIELVLTI